MPISEKDALEQTIKDRDARVAESKKDRRNRTIVASIAAAASIFAAFVAAIIGIDKFAEKKDTYQIITGGGSLDPAQTAGV